MVGVCRDLNSTVNRRVASSNLARGAILLQFVQWITTTFRVRDPYALMPGALTSILTLIALLFIGCGSNGNYAGVARKPPNPSTIVFMTDFGTANDAVAICKAVILNIAPDIRIMDITHQVTPFSIEEGARFLAGVTPYYPPC